MNTLRLASLKLSWVYHKLKYRRQLQLARNALRAFGGSSALYAMDVALLKAEKYSSWSAWYLDPVALYWLGKLILSEGICSVVEFGSGYSTVVLTEFLARIAPEVTLDSFEHQTAYRERLAHFIPSTSKTTLRFANLTQLDEKDFEDLFLSHDPSQIILNRGMDVPEELLHNTRLQNVFYKIDFKKISMNGVSLVILDGPNGNGRSAVFPLLRNVVTQPVWMLIDDYLDYPFLAMLERVFRISESFVVNNNQKKCILVKIVKK